MPDDTKLADEIEKLRTEIREQHEQQDRNGRRWAEAMALAGAGVAIAFFSVEFLKEQIAVKDWRGILLGSGLTICGILLIPLSFKRAEAGAAMERPTHRCSWGLLSCSTTPTRKSWGLFWYFRE